jgi:hypothetical protein
MNQTTRKPDFFAIMKQAGMDKEGTLALLNLWRTSGLTHVKFRGYDIPIPPKEPT